MTPPIGSGDELRANCLAVPNCRIGAVIEMRPTAAGDVIGFGIAERILCVTPLVTTIIKIHGQTLCRS
jgi:hypothetical protein